MDIDDRDILMKRPEPIFVADRFPEILDALLDLLSHEKEKR
jgi:hypothetical protein